ncbi:MAG TPA: hypothetical protein DD473_14430, partial [Planctomycetaceae bacterium]|nr:hypothetical protein [Planctomycetaceae bacterium]
AVPSLTRRVKMLSIFHTLTSHSFEFQRFAKLQLVISEHTRWPFVLVLNLIFLAFAGYIFKEASRVVSLIHECLITDELRRVRVKRDR